MVDQRRAVGASRKKGDEAKKKSRGPSSVRCWFAPQRYAARSLTKAPTRRTRVPTPAVTARASAPMPAPEQRAAAIATRIRMESPEREEARGRRQNRRPSAVWTRPHHVTLPCCRAYWGLKGVGHCVSDDAIALPTLPSTTASHRHFAPVPRFSPCPGWIEKPTIDNLVCLSDVPDESNCLAPSLYGGPLVGG